MHLAGRQIIWLVYAGIFIGGALRAFLGPSSFALQGMLVPRELYPNSTTWSSTSWQIGAVLGPLFGGFMILSGYTTALVTVGIIEVIHWWQ
jgi:MFS family permease